MHKRTPETQFKKFMSEKERQQILDFALESSPSVRLVIHVLDKMGLRVSEAISIREDDVDFENKILTIHATKQGKILQRRIPECLLRRLKVHIAQFNDFFYDGYLMFPTPGHGSTSKHMSKNSIGWFFVRFRERYGYTKPYFICENGKPLYRHASHTFRSRWISKFYELSGGDVRLAQLEIGHVKPDTTMKYVRFSDRQKKVDLILDAMFTAQNKSEGSSTDLVDQKSSSSMSNHVQEIELQDPGKIYTA